MESIFPYPAQTQQSGVPCYHPDVAGAEADFPSESFERLIKVEDGHFWFESRNVILKDLIQRALAARWTAIALFGNRLAAPGLCFA